MSVKLKPFIKWVGGKRQLLSEIDTHLPQNVTELETYVEPFLGGGAVLLHMLETQNFKQIWAGDLNEELINTYEMIKTQPDVLIKNLTILQKEYVALPNLVAKKEYYLKNRTIYNHKIGSNKNDPKIPALFIFLNRTGFNGLYRVNSKGQFNVPFGQHVNPLILDEQNIKALHKAFQKVNFYIGGYQKAEKHITNKTFVYLDPPYRPLSNSSTFTSYTNSAFNDEHQTQLAQFVHNQHTKQAYVLLSNSDPHNTNPTDNFFDNLYNWATIVRVQATRAVNSKSTGRGKISEIMVKNYLIATNKT